MTAITTTTDVPTVGGDEDTWGAKLNAKWAAAKVDLDMLNTAPANTILGRNEGTTGEVERLTVTEATAMLDTLVGDSGAGGTKGLVPAPAAGDAAARKFLLADATWVADERKGWAIITGSTGALVAGRGLSCTRTGSGYYDFTFSTALADANYAVFLSCQDTEPNLRLAKVSPTGKAASGFTVIVTTQAAAPIDPAQLYVTVVA